MKKWITLGSLGLVLVALLIAVLPVAAVTCQPVSVSNPQPSSVPVNAAWIANTGDAFSGDYDGSGCDIVIYIPPGVTGVTITGRVHDANKYGVYVDGAANVTINNSEVYRIGNHNGAAYDPNGVQTGLTIVYRNGATGTVSNSNVHDYQKNGITVTGAGTAVAILNNVVTGAGQVNYIAQNGIQISSGAAATVSGNTITGHYWTGCSHQDAAKTGCIPWVSTGILLYDIAPPAQQIANNRFRDNQFNHYMSPSTP
jgi:Right handed beta helix region